SAARGRAGGGFRARLSVAWVLADDFCFVERVDTAADVKLRELADIIYVGDVAVDGIGCEVVALGALLGDELPSFDRGDALRWVAGGWEGFGASVQRTHSGEWAAPSVENIAAGCALLRVRDGRANADDAEQEKSATEKDSG